MVRISRFFGLAQRKLREWTGVRVSDGKASHEVIPNWIHGGEVPEHLMLFKIGKISTEDAREMLSWLTVQAQPIANTHRPTVSIDEVAKHTKILQGRFYRPGHRKGWEGVLQYEAKDINAIRVMAATKDPQTIKRKQFEVGFARTVAREIEKWVREYKIEKSKVERAMKQMQLNPETLNQDLIEKQISIVLDQGFRGFKKMSGTRGKLTTKQKQALVAIRWVMA